MDRKKRIALNRRQLADGKKIIPIVVKPEIKKTAYKKRMIITDKETVGYHESYGDLLITMGSQGLPFSAFSGFVYKNLNLKITRDSFFKWAKNIKHFQLCFEIYKSTLEMWKIQVILNPPKVTLKSGQLKSVKEKGKLVYKVDPKKVYFREEQIKSNIFKQTIEIDNIMTENINPEALETSQILDVKPTEENVKAWNKKIEKYETTGRSALLEKVLKKIEEKNN